jgi:cytochrome bd-type quinol oxidase subunit 2
MLKLRFPAAALPKRDDDLSDYRHRQIIGYIGLVLPLLLILLVLWRDGEASWRNLDSVSAYYYTGAVTLFVGMLVALAFFLALYEGYNNDYRLVDRGFAIAAALAALGVAFFPTEAPQGYLTPHWWKEWIGWVHFGSAFVLFGLFAIFSLWLFREKAHATQAKSELDKGKPMRNLVYFICGVAIVVCIGLVVYNARRGVSIFWPESGALVAFAVSWLTKGRALKSIVAVVRPGKP